MGRRSGRRVFRSLRLPVGLAVDVIVQPGEGAYRCVGVQSFGPDVARPGAAPLPLQQRRHWLPHPQQQLHRRQLRTNGSYPSPSTFEDSAPHATPTIATGELSPRGPPGVHPLLEQSSEMTHLSWFADPAGPGQFFVPDPNPQAPVLRHRGNGSARCAPDRSLGSHRSGAERCLQPSQGAQSSAPTSQAEITDFLDGSHGVLSSCLHGAGHVRT